MGVHDKLWNDLPLAERQRLAPYELETHILHLTQCRAMIVRNHVQQLRELDDWIKNCRRDLDKMTAERIKQTG